MSLDFYLIAEIDTGGVEPFIAYLFEANATHNLTPMWSLAGVYDALYMSHGKLAGEIRNTLLDGCRKMIAEKAEFEKLNPSNGWGNYDCALEFLTKTAQACAEHPKAKIRMSK